MVRDRRVRTIAGTVGTLLLLTTFNGSAVGADVSRAGTVGNSSGSNTVAQVVWSESYDPATDEGRFGGIYGDIEDWGTVVGLWESDSRLVECDNGTTDPSDDFMGMATTWRSGDGPGTVTIAPNLKGAVVTGVLTITTATTDPCAGTYTIVATETDVAMRLDLVATDQPAPWADRYHERLAAVYNSHQILRSMSRSATGTALLGGRSYAFDSGLISRNSWNSHENAR